MHSRSLVTTFGDKKHAGKLSKLYPSVQNSVPKFHTHSHSHTNNEPFYSNKQQRKWENHQTKENTQETVLSTFIVQQGKNHTHTFLNYTKSIQKKATEV